MKSGSLVMVASAAGLAAAQTVPTVHIPLNLYFGANHKVSTNIYVASANQTIEVVYDQGSENFFLFGPGSVDNWGSSALGGQGPCNVSVPPEFYFDYPNSPTATSPVNHSATYAYGGLDKIYTGTITVNDTFGFVNDAGARNDAVDDVRVEIVNFLVQRINDPTCSNGGPLYDPSILGISPYYNNASSRPTVGPHVRQDLLERGVIDAAVQSMWFDEAPEDVYGTYTGGGLLGGIDTSKYSGDLVKVKTLLPSGYVGYFTEMPTVTVNGVAFSKPTNIERCQLDSGTHGDSIPVSYDEDEAFFNASGIVLSPKGYVSWPGECDTIPANATVDLTFPGTVDGESITIPVPIKSYVRVDYGNPDPGYCILSVETSGCLLGAPFATASFFAADDEAGQIALAKGGVSQPGAAVDEASVIASIP